MATIRDVATLAGVSIATVSAVINNTAPVRPALRERVLSAIAEVGYQPHGIARSLKTGISRTVGLVISDVTNPFFGAVARTVEAALQRQGHAMLLCNSDEDPATEEAYLKLLQNHRVAGIILAPAGTGAAYGQLVAQLIRAPAVLIDRTNPDLPLDAVTVDNADGTRAAVEHLLDLGCRRVGLVLGSPQVSTSEERLAGYQAALTARGLPFEPRLVRHGRFRQDQAFLACRALLADERPDAIFAANNLMAIGALQAVAAAGLRCPADVAVGCFDDFEWADVCAPKITTVAQPTTAIAERAVSLLFDRIAGGETGAPRRVVLPTRMVARTTQADRSLT